SDELKNRMINAGIVRVRVSSLVPNTPYFYRLVTTPTTTGVDLIKPAAGPYHSVVTAQRAFVASNDTAGLSVLNASGTTPAPGSLVIMQVEGSPYPLSAIAGDGYSGGFTGINLSNLYPTEQSFNRELNGGEHAVLTVKAGSG